MIPQAIPRDSVARVVSDVLAAPAYDWHQGRSLTAWLRTVWRALLAWLERFAQDHPVGYVVFLLALTAVLIALLVHMGWVLHRALNPSQRTKLNHTQNAPSGTSKPVRPKRSQIPCGCQWRWPSRSWE